MRSKHLTTWTGKRSSSDLLNPDQAVDALGGHVIAQAIRKRVREGALKCHTIPETPGLIFVKRGELLALYESKINGWKGVKR